RELQAAGDEQERPLRPALASRLRYGRTRGDVPAAARVDLPARSDARDRRARHASGLAPRGVQRARPRDRPVATCRALRGPARRRVAALRHAAPPPAPGLAAYRVSAVMSF